MKEYTIVINAEMPTESKLFSRTKTYIVKFEKDIEAIKHGLKLLYDEANFDSNVYHYAEDILYTLTITYFAFHKQETIRILNMEF